MITVLKLLYGPKDNPTSTLDLNQAAKKIYLRQSGFAPGAGAKQIQWSGSSSFRDGQRRIHSSRENATFQLTYAIDSGSSVDEVRYWQSEISRFVEHVRQFEEKRVGAQIWLQYDQESNLSDISEPVYGLSLRRYLRVRDLEIPNWPGNLHGGTLQSSYAVSDIVAQITTDPYAEALEIEAMAGTSVPGYETGVTMSASEMAAQFTIAGWVQHRASDYVAWEYYVDSTHYIRLEWDESDSRFEITHNTGGGAATSNCSTSSHSVGDWVHLVFYQDGANRYVRVNNTQRLSGSYNAWGNSGVLRLGNAASVGTTAITNLDGWQVWNDDVTSTQAGYLYTNQSPIKSGGYNVAPVPYCKTRTTRQIDAVDGVVSASAKDNYAVVGNVPGDAEATCRLEFDPPTSGPPLNYVISRNAQDSTITPLASTFIDFFGTAASGTSSGDAYESSGANWSFDFDGAVSSPAAIRGDVTVYGRLTVATTDIQARPYVRYGLSQRIQPTIFVTVPADVQTRLRKLGSMRLDWPQSTTPPTVIAGVKTQAVSSSTLLDGLQSWLPLTDASGVRFDTVGNHHLTERGAISTATGARGIAAEFNAVNYLVVNSNNNLFLPGDFAISVWVYFYAVTGVQGVLGKFYDAAGGREFMLYLSSGSIIWTVSNNGTATTGVSGGALSATTWYHIYAYHDEGTGIGISVENGSPTTAAHTTGCYQSQSELTVGAFTGGASPSNTRIQYIGFWNRLLTAAERNVLYNSVAAVGDYPFSSTIPTVGFDFVNILTRPVAEIRGHWPALASGDTINITGQEAWTEDASDSDSQLNRLEVLGDEITLLPNKYNYLTMLLGGDGDVYPVTPAVTNFRCYVTPRWHLP